METNLNESNVKLVEFSTQYSKFNKNQVLTETQLNGFLDYFDDQGRLTRTSLNGVGIVCGFEVSLTEDGINITQGRGVTTDGDLLALLNPVLLENGEPKETKNKTLDLESKTYTHYKAFFDTNALYPKFSDPEGEQIPLYELRDSSDDDFIDLSNFKTNELKVISDMVVLLYVEGYPKKADLCNQLTCDNQGIEQIARLRVLLISKDHADYISKQDSIFSQHNWYETYTKLPVVTTDRIVVNPRVTRSYTRLKQSYYDTVVKSKVAIQLQDGINMIFGKLNQNKIPKVLFDRIFNFELNKVPVDFQYRYDALKDLIDTYNEMKDLLLEMNVECCPTIGAFPKHLMLGRVVETAPYPTFRHQFYKSPIIPEDNTNYQKVMSLVNRVNELLTRFNINDKTGEIRITPSLDISVLSNKAVPFYYNLSNPLLKYWDFFKTKRFLEKRNLSYHREKLANIPSVKNPLDYNLDPFDFYRIEGHQGRPYKDALKKINTLKTEKGLNFDVKVLSIETGSNDFSFQRYACHFEDLRAMFNAWKAEQECILEQIVAFFSAFSTTVPGKNWISEQQGYDSLERAIKEKEALLEAEKEKAEQEKDQKELEIQQEKDKLIQELLDKVNSMEDVVVKEDAVDQPDKGDQVVVDGKEDVTTKENPDKTDGKSGHLYDYYRDKIGDDKVYHGDKDYSLYKEYYGDPSKDLSDKEKKYYELYGEYLRDDASKKDLYDKGMRSDELYKEYYGDPSKDLSDKEKKYHELYGEYYGDGTSKDIYDGGMRSDKLYEEYYGDPSKDLSDKEKKYHELYGEYYGDGTSKDLYNRGMRSNELYKEYYGDPSKDLSDREKKYHELYKDYYSAHYSNLHEGHMKSHDLYKEYQEGHFPEGDEKIEMHHRINMISAVNDDALAEEKKRAYYAYLESIEADKSEKKKHNLSDLAKGLDKGEDEKEKVVKEKPTQLTKDQLAAQERELTQQFKEKLIALEKQGASKETIAKYIDKFEAYMKDLKEGKVTYVPSTKDKQEVVTTGKVPSKVITTKESVFKATVVDRINTIGNIFLEVLKENQGAAPEVILKAVQNEVNQVTQSSVWTQEPELKEFILNQVIRTLAIAYILDYNLPRGIERLSQSALNTYENILTMLCEQIKDLQASFSVARLEAGTEQITDMLMNQLASVCCSGKQLGVIYNEIQTRIESILLKTRLFEFVKSHPGLEHKAGVKSGGTFVMVYLEGDEQPVIQKTQTSLDLKFLEIPKVESIGEEEMILQLWEEKLKFNFRFVNEKFADELKDDFSMVRVQESLEATLRGFANLLNRNFAISGVLDVISAVSKENVLRITIQDKTGIEGKVFFQTNNPALLGTEEPFVFEIEPDVEDFLQVKDRVVADFSLPYMCCSDCAPVNFVVPKDPPILRLPQKYVCLKNEEPVIPLPFSVSPKDGEIEAEVFENIESGLTFDDEGNAFFDASLTDPSLYEQEIGFKVDGEATNCKIIVYPEPPMSVTSSVEYNELRTRARVTFTVSHIYPKLEHTWRDGIEGHVSNDKPDADGNVSFVYDDLPVNETNTITPTLTISNGFCEKVVEIEPITFKEPITEVKLEIQPTYCIDNAGGEKTSIPFTLVNPADEGLIIRFAKEKVKGLEIVGNELIINPSEFNTFYETIEFTLGGLPTEANIKVFPSLIATISSEKGDVIARSVSYYQEYFFKANFDATIKTEGIDLVWEVDGVERAKGEEFTVNFPIKEELTTYVVVLKATQEGGCATEVKTVVEVENPDFKLTLPDNRTKFCLSDETSYPITIFPESEGVVVEGIGVSHDPDQDVYFFTPSKTGFSVATIVPLTIDGNTYLKLKVDTIAVARFEVKIENREIVVINSSDDADEYIFNVGGVEETFTTKDSFRISVDKFDQELIDVSLTTVTFCGKDIAKQTGISLKTSLELPVRTVCLKEGEEVLPLAFTVIPEGGKVEALVDASFKSGLFYDENRQPFFDASLTDPKLYGTPIEFTLDGRKTDCSITVFAELPLTAIPFVSYNSDKTGAKVTFKVVENYSNVEFIWTDDLGHEASEQPDADGLVSFLYKLPVNETNTVQISLTLVSGPCPTIITFDPITFDDPITDFNLNIQNTFCIEEANGENASIPFTNISPEGEAIEIAGGPVEGLVIVDNDLVIEVNKFTRFNERFDFTLGGNPTAANITIYSALEVGINAIEGELKLVNNQLVRAYSLTAVLPDGMSTVGLSFEWEINGQVVSQVSETNHDFEVFQSPIGYEVRLRVNQNGGCPSEKSTIINVEYPEFFMRIPNNRLEYCFNDGQSYPITLNPPVEGAVIEGLGMSRNALNENVFTPNQTGLQDAGSVPLSFDGLTYLTLNILTIPQASFTVEVIDNELRVANTSDTAQEYIFDVAGEIITYQRKVSFKRSLDLFPTDTIDIFLTTKSLCGDSFAEEKGIKIREGSDPDPVDDGSCVSETLGRISVDAEKLPRNVDFSTEVRDLVINPTIFQYDNVLNTPQMLNGGIFSDIMIFGTLFNDTASNIVKFKDDEQSRLILSEYLIGQVKLFFNMLHCQPHEALLIEEQTITQMMNELHGALKRLRGEGIQYDKQRVLETFFKDYSGSINVIEFIKKFIENPLLPEVQASNNVL